ncbi:MAG: TRAP transporter small permease [Desulfobaccales bacterium]
MLDRILARILEVLVILLAAVIVGVVTTDVALRYLFGSALVFTEELSRYLMVWVVFLGSALAIRDNSHIRIGVFISRLPAGLKFLAELLSDISILVFCAVLIIEGVRILPAQFQENTTTLGITMFWFYLPIPLGCFLMAFFVLLRIRQAFADRACERQINKGEQ